MNDIKSRSDHVLFRLQQIKYDAFRAIPNTFELFLSFKTFELRNCLNDFADPVNPEEKISRKIKLECAPGLRRA